jgi:hypothetical protein
MSDMRRREFITLLGGAAAWPLAARAQQSGRIPKVGFLFPGTETVGPLRIAAFVEGLQPSAIVCRIRSSWSPELPEAIPAVLRQWQASSWNATLMSSSRTVQQRFRLYDC